MTVAHGLAEAGQRVIVLDKGRSPGGRLVSRAVGGANLETGPLEVAVRTSEVADEILRRAGQSVTAEASDGKSVLTWSTHSNEAVARWATGLDIRHVFVTHLEPRADGALAVVPYGSGEAITCSRVVLTAPGPQCEQLLLNSGLLPPDSLAEVSYEKRLLLLAEVTRTGATETPLPSEFLSLRQSVDFDGDRGGGGAISLIASPGWSDEAWALDDNFAHARLLLELRRMMPATRVVKSHLKRWRYANAVTTHSSGFARLSDSDRILVGGDGFGDPAASGVERAVASGLQMLAFIAEGRS
jgi:predicted NAD/FAD-dependent oxidoreductase